MAIDWLTKKELPENISRVQSPSSINTYGQCPRKYFYVYKEKLQTGRSIHLTRGVITHTTLEVFFDIDVSNIPEDSFMFTLKIILNETFKKEWAKGKEELDSLGMTKEEIQGYYDETKDMVNNYFEYFTDKMNYFQRFMSIKEAWEAVKPQRELLLSSEIHWVRGYVDAIHDEAGKTIILDYKTSKRAKITPEYKLQLGIYAMLYEEKFRLPDMVGIYFLKEGKEMLLDVDPEMVEEAKKTCTEIHLNTRSDSITDYPKKTSPLCKWSTGQCDFYEVCMQGMSIEEYKEKNPKRPFRG